MASSSSWLEATVEHLLRDLDVADESGGPIDDLPAKWINFASDDRWTLGEYHAGVTHKTPSVAPASRDDVLDPEEHAGIVDIDYTTEGGNAIKAALISRWRARLQAFSLSESSFASLLEKRFAVLTQVFGQLSQRELLSTLASAIREYVHSLQVLRPLAVSYSAPLAARPSPGTTGSSAEGKHLIASLWDGLTAATPSAWGVTRSAADSDLAPSGLDGPAQFVRMVLAKQRAAVQDKAGGLSLIFPFADKLQRAHAFLNELGSMVAPESTPTAVPALLQDHGVPGILTAALAAALASGSVSHLLHGLRICLSAHQSASASPLRSSSTGASSGSSEELSALLATAEQQETSFDLSLPWISSSHDLVSETRGCAHTLRDPLGPWSNYHSSRTTRGILDGAFVPRSIIASSGSSAAVGARGVPRTGDDSGAQQLIVALLHKVVSLHSASSSYMSTRQLASFAEVLADLVVKDSSNRMPSSSSDGTGAAAAPLADISAAAIGLTSVPYLTPKSVEGRAVQACIDELQQRLIVRDRLREADRSIVLDMSAPLSSAIVAAGPGAASAASNGDAAPSASAASVAARAPWAGPDSGSSGLAAGDARALPKALQDDKQRPVPSSAGLFGTGAVKVERLLAGQDLPSVLSASSPSASSSLGAESFAVPSFLKAPAGVSAAPAPAGSAPAAFPAGLSWSSGPAAKASPASSSSAPAVQHSTKGHAMASDGQYLYIHLAGGLHKMGTGYHGTIRGTRYGFVSYRPSERIQLACIARPLAAETAVASSQPADCGTAGPSGVASPVSRARLVVSSDRILWPNVELVDCNTLTVVGQVQLGLDLHRSGPSIAPSSALEKISTQSSGSSRKEDGRSDSSSKETPAAKKPESSSFITPPSSSTKEPANAARVDLKAAPVICSDGRLLYVLHIESHIPAWDVTGSWEGSAEQRYDRKFVQSFSRYRKQLASSNGADETKHETKHAEGKSRAVKSKRKLIPVSSPAAAVAQAESAPVSAAASAASSLPSPFQASAVDSSFVADDSSAPSVNRSPVASVPAVAVVAPAQPASMPSLVSQPGAVGQEVQVVAVAPIAAFAANAELVAGPAAMAAPKADEALMMSSSPSESSAHGAAALDRASNAPSVPALAAQPSQPASVSAPVPDSVQSLSIPVAPPVVAGALMAKTPNPRSKGRRSAGLKEPFSFRASKTLLSDRRERLVVYTYDLEQLVPTSYQQATPSIESPHDLVLPVLPLPQSASSQLCSLDRADLTEPGLTISQALLHRQLERSYFAACDLLEATAGRFTLPQCVLAIEACGADKDRAVQWLSTHADQLTLERARAPLVRRAVLGVLNSDLSKPDEDPSSAFLVAATVYATHHQVVCLLPSNIKPWTSDKAIAKVFWFPWNKPPHAPISFDQVGQVVSGPAACFDYLNNVVWLSMNASSGSGVAALQPNGPPSTQFAKALVVESHPNTGPSFWPHFPATVSGISALAPITTAASSSQIAASTLPQEMPAATRSDSAAGSFTLHSEPSFFASSHVPLEPLLRQSCLGTLSAEDVLGLLPARNALRLDDRLGTLQVSAFCLAHSMRNLRHRMAGSGQRLCSPVLSLTSTVHKAVAEYESLRGQLDREKASEAKSALKPAATGQAEASPVSGVSAVPVKLAVQAAGLSSLSSASSLVAVPMPSQPSSPSLFSVAAATAEEHEVKSASKAAVLDKPSPLAHLEKRVAQALDSLQAAKADLAEAISRDLLPSLTLTSSTAAVAERKEGDVDGAYIAGIVHASPHCFQLSDETFDCILNLLQLAEKEVQQLLRQQWTRASVSLGPVSFPSASMLSDPMAAPSRASAASFAPESWVVHTTLWCYVLTCCLQLLLAHLQALSLVLDVVDSPCGALSREAPQRVLRNSASLRSVLLALALELPGHCIDPDRMLFSVGPNTISDLSMRCLLVGFRVLYNTDSDRTTMLHNLMHAFRASTNIASAAPFALPTPAGDLSGPVADVSPSSLLGALARSMPLTKVCTSESFTTAAASKGIAGAVSSLETEDAAHFFQLSGRQTNQRLLLDGVLLWFANHPRASAIVCPPAPSAGALDTKLPKSTTPDPLAFFRDLADLVNEDFNRCLMQRCLVSLLPRDPSDKIRKLASKSEDKTKKVRKPRKIRSSSAHRSRSSRGDGWADVPGSDSSKAAGADGSSAVKTGPRSIRLSVTALRRLCSAAATAASALHTSASNGGSSMPDGSRPEWTSDDLSEDDDVSSSGRSSAAESDEADADSDHASSSDSNPSEDLRVRSTAEDTARTAVADRTDLPKTTGKSQRTSATEAVSRVAMRDSSRTFGRCWRSDVEAEMLACSRVISRRQTSSPMQSDPAVMLLSAIVRDLITQSHTLSAVQTPSTSTDAVGKRAAREDVRSSSVQQAFRSPAAGVAETVHYPHLYANAHTGVSAPAMFPAGSLPNAAVGTSSAVTNAHSADRVLRTFVESVEKSAFTVSADAARRTLLECSAVIFKRCKAVIDEATSLVRVLQTPDAEQSVSEDPSSKDGTTPSGASAAAVTDSFALCLLLTEQLRSSILAFSQPLVACLSSPTMLTLCVTPDATSELESGQLSLLLDMVEERMRVKRGTEVSAPNVGDTAPKALHTASTRSGALKLPAITPSALPITPTVSIPGVSSKNQPITTHGASIQRPAEHAGRMFSRFASNEVSRSTVAVSTFRRVISLLSSLDGFNRVLPAELGVQADQDFVSAAFAEDTAAELVETPHPYPSGHQVLRQTVRFPNASAVAITFDPRSCTVGGSDELRIYRNAPEDPLEPGMMLPGYKQSKVLVASFSGLPPALAASLGSVGRRGQPSKPFSSPFGQPNASVSSGSWPKRSVIISQTNSVTFVFSARSNQSNKEIPAKARWGFAASVRPIRGVALPWLLDLECSFSGLGGRLAGSLIAGPPPCISEHRVHGWSTRQSDFRVFAAGLEPQKSLLLSPLLPFAAALQDPPVAALTRDHADIPAWLGFLDAFITGDRSQSQHFPDLHRLWTLVDSAEARHGTRFVGELLVSRLKPRARASWDRALRAVMAACFKHSGLVPQLYQAFAGSSSKRQHTVAEVPPQDASAVQSAVFASVRAALSLRDWLLKLVQRTREWLYWRNRPSLEVPSFSRAAADGSAAAVEAKQLEEKAPSVATTNSCVLSNNELRLPFSWSEFFATFGDQHDAIHDFCQLKRVRPPPPASTGAELESAARKLYEILVCEWKDTHQQTSVSPSTDADQVLPYEMVCADVEQSARSLLAFQSVVSSASTTDSAPHLPAQAVPVLQQPLRRSSSQPHSQQVAAPVLTEVSSLGSVDTVQSGHIAVNLGIQVMPTERPATDRPEYAPSGTSEQMQAELQPPPSDVLKHGDVIDGVIRFVRGRLLAGDVLAAFRAHESRVASRSKGIRYLSVLTQSVSFDAARAPLLGVVWRSILAFQRHHRHLLSLDLEETAILSSASNVGSRFPVIQALDRRNTSSVDLCNPAGEASRLTVGIELSSRKATSSLRDAYEAWFSNHLSFLAAEKQLAPRSHVLGFKSANVPDVGSFSTVPSSPLIRLLVTQDLLSMYWAPSDPFAVLHRQNDVLATLTGAVSNARALSLTVALEKDELQPLWDLGTPSTADATGATQAADSRSESKVLESKEPALPTEAVGVSASSEADEDDMIASWTGAAVVGAKSVVPAAVKARNSLIWDALRLHALQVIAWNGPRLQPYSRQLQSAEDDPSLSARSRAMGLADPLGTLMVQASEALCQELKVTLELAVRLSRRHDLCAAVRPRSAALAQQLLSTHSGANRAAVAASNDADSTATSCTPPSTVGDPLSAAQRLTLQRMVERPLSLCERPSAYVAGRSLHDVRNSAEQIMRFMLIILPELLSSSLEIRSRNASAEMPGPEASLSPWVLQIAQHLGVACLRVIRWSNGEAACRSVVSARLFQISTRVAKQVWPVCDPGTLLRIAIQEDSNIGIETQLVSRSLDLASTLLLHTGVLLSDIGPDPVAGVHNRKLDQLHPLQSSMDRRHKHAVLLGEVDKERSRCLHTGAPLTTPDEERKNLSASGREADPLVGAVLELKVAGDATVASAPSVASNAVGDVSKDAGIENVANSSSSLPSDIVIVSTGVDPDVDTDDMEVDEADVTAEYSVVLHYRSGLAPQLLEKLFDDPGLQDLALGRRVIKQEGCDTANASVGSAEHAKAQAAFQRRSAFRHGPARVGIAAKAGELDFGTKIKGSLPPPIDASLTPLRCRAVNMFCTVMADVKVTKGKWYYEVHLLTRDLAQIGWATAEHRPSAERGEGVGDDVHSWAYDGHRVLKWHKHSVKYGRPWRAGDIVGVCADLDRGEIRFLLNGDDMGVAYTGVDAGGGLYPAASISKGEAVQFVFDSAHLRQSPPPSFYPLQGDKAGGVKGGYRARQIVSDLEALGHAVLISGPERYCMATASRLVLTAAQLSAGSSSSPVLVTVMRASEVESLLPLDVGRNVSVARRRNLVSQELAAAESLIEAASTVKTQVTGTNSKGNAAPQVSAAELVNPGPATYQVPKHQDISTLYLSNDVADFSCDDVYGLLPVPEIGFEPVVINGYARDLMASELISVLRMFACVQTPLHWEDNSDELQGPGSNSVQSPKSVSAWVTMTKQSVLRAIIEFFDSKPVLTDARIAILVGALSVLGGYSEFVRPAGYVRLPSSMTMSVPSDGTLVSASETASSASSVGVVLQYQHPGPVARVVPLSELEHIRLRTPDFSVVFPTAGLKIVDEAPGVLASSSGGAAVNADATIDASVQSLSCEGLQALSDVAPSLAHFPLTEQLFQALRDLMVPGSSSRAAMPMSNRVVSELRWRSMGVLDSLLAHTGADALEVLLETPDRLRSLGDFLRGFTRSTLASEPLNDLAGQTQQLHRKLSDIGHQIVYKFALTPLTAPTPVSAEVKTNLAGVSAAERVASPRMVIYSSSSFVEDFPSYSDVDAEQSGSSDSRMLQYWNRYIMPPLQAYLKDSFRDYEKEYFYETVRQQARRGDNAAAIDIANQLTNGHVPEGLNYPAQDHDFDVVFVNEVFVGQYLLVSDHADRVAKQAEAAVWESREGMTLTLGKVGLVKSVVPQSELVLLQFTDVWNGSTAEWWYPVGCLKVPAFVNRSRFCDGLFVVRHVAQELARVESELLPLLARRALFRMCSGPPGFLFHLAPLATLDVNIVSGTNLSKEDIFDYVFLAVSEALQSLNQGSLVVNPSCSTPALAALQANLAEYLRVACSGGSYRRRSSFVRARSLAAHSLPLSRTLTPLHAFGAQTEPDVSRADLHVANKAAQPTNLRLLRTPTAPVSSSTRPEPSAAMHLTRTLSGAGKAHPSRGVSVRRNSIKMINENADRSVLSATSLLQLLLRHFGDLLHTASRFTSENTAGITLVTSADSKSSSTASSALKMVEISGASGLLCLFVTNHLPSGSSVTFYGDVEASRVIRVYKGRQLAPSALASPSVGHGWLTPLAVPGCRCWVRLDSAQSVKVQLQVIPIHSAFGVAFWLVDFLLQQDFLINSTADGPTQQSSATSSRVSSTDFCFQFCAMLFDRFQATAMHPSPLKEALLRLVSTLLTTAKQLSPQVETPSSCDSISSSPQAAACLEQLAALRPELKDVAALERSSRSYTSYLQQLLDSVVVSEHFRMPSQRLTSAFRFDPDDPTPPLLKQPPVPSPAEQKAPVEPPAALPPSSWNCEACTFENPLSNGECEMCGAPKPRDAGKKVVESIASVPTSVALDRPTTTEDVSVGMLHDITALVGVVRYLVGAAVARPTVASKIDGDAVLAPSVGTTIDDAVLTKVAGTSSSSSSARIWDSLPIDHDEWLAVRPLIDASARQLRLDAVEYRLMVLTSVPLGSASVVQRWIADTVQSAHAGVRVDPASIYLGVDPTLPALQEEMPVVEPAEPEEQLVQCPWKGPNLKPLEMDEDGIVFFLATKGKSQPWSNPHSAGIVTVQASSIHEDSQGPAAVVGRKAVRCVTKPDDRQWFAVRFPPNCFIEPTHYQLRHYVSFKTEALRSWRFEGSNDGVQWDVLREHVNDQGLDDKGALCTWELSTKAGAAYNQFRVFMTGMNSNGHLYLALSGFEVYGTLRGRSIRPKPKPPIVSSPGFAVVELLNSDPEVITKLLQHFASLEFDSTVLPANADSAQDRIRPRRTVVKACRFTDLEHPWFPRYPVSLSAFQVLLSRLLRGSPPVSELLKVTRLAGDDADFGFQDVALSRPDTVLQFKPRALAALARIFGLYATVIHEDDDVKVGCNLTGDTSSRHTVAVLLDRIPGLLAYVLRVPTPAAPSPESDATWRSAIADANGHWDVLYEYVTSLLQSMSVPVRPVSSIAGSGSADVDSDPPLGVPFMSFIEFMAKLILFPGALPSVPVSSISQPSSIAPDGFGWGVRFVWRWLRGAGFDLNLQCHALGLDPDHADNDDAYNVQLVSQGIWTPIRSLQLMSLLQQVATRVGQSSLLRMMPTQVILHDGDLAAYPALSALALTSSSPRGDLNGVIRDSNVVTQALCAAQSLCPAEQLEVVPGWLVSSIRLRFEFLKRSNVLVANVLPMVDLRRATDTVSIPGLIRAGRPFVFAGVKISYMQQVFDVTASKTSLLTVPKLEIDRMTTLALRERGVLLDFMRHSMLCRAYQQLRHVSPALLRPPRPQGTEPFYAFELVFSGEHVVGEGGPWRQFFTDVANELQDTEGFSFSGVSAAEPSASLAGIPVAIGSTVQAVSGNPLLIPCPNAVAKVGFNRDSFLFRPSSNSAAMLELFEFLGMLFGWCLRTGVRLPLQLPSFVWKPLVNEPLSKLDLDDVDHETVQMLQFIDECDAVSFDEFCLGRSYNPSASEASPILEESAELTFSCRLSDRSTVDLVLQGSTRLVTFEERKEFTALFLSARLNEHQLQVDAVRRGISRVIPIQVLNLLTWQELELLVCGKQDVDVDLLRRHTQYSKGLTADDPHIESFWRVLNSFDPEQRRGFIRFAWGQERLPADDEEMTRSHTRLLIKPSPYQHPDRALPRADTCFFNLELPAYSSDQIMRSRLLYAISSGVTMNADENVEDMHGHAGRQNRIAAFQNE